MNQIECRIVREAPPAPYAGTTAGGPECIARIAAAVMHELTGDSPQEHFVVFLLDAQNRITDFEIVTKGLLDSNLVHPRETFRAAIVKNAASVVVAHNHPTGDTRPSPQDFDVTERLHAAGELLGVPLLDHVIVGSAGGRPAYRAMAAIVARAERGEPDEIGEPMMVRERPAADYIGADAFRLLREREEWLRAHGATPEELDALRESIRARLCEVTLRHRQERGDWAEPAYNARVVREEAEALSERLEERIEKKLRARVRADFGDFAADKVHFMMVRESVAPVAAYWWEAEDAARSRGRAALTALRKERQLRIAKLARKLIADPDGWCRGALAQNSKGVAVFEDDGDACRFCLHGAIGAASFRLVSPGVPRDEGAVDRLSRLLLQLAHQHGWIGLAQLNDEGGQEEAVAALDSAIRLLESPTDPDPPPALGELLDTHPWALEDAQDDMVLRESAPSYALRQHRVVTGARELIADKSRWCRYAVARDRDGRQVFGPHEPAAHSFCLRGAIEHALAAEDAPFEVAAAVYGRTKRLAEDRGHTGIENANDYGGHAVVLSILDEFAAELA